MFRTFNSDTSNFLKYETQCDSKYPYNDCRNDSLNEIKGTKQENETAINKNTQWVWIL